MNIKELQDCFEEEGFNVSLSMEDGVQCAEIEKWTNGGVDMITLLRPFSEESFIEYVDNFDISEEIDLHRQDIAYVNNFTVLAGVEDFTSFHKSLMNTMMRMKGEPIEDDYSELVAPEKIIASMMKVVDYLWEKEMRHFEETYSLQIESQDDLKTWIKLCEKNGWTEHIFYNLMLMKLNLEP
jgi:hypothetical protein